MEANVHIYVAPVETPTKGHWFKLPFNEGNIRLTLLGRGALTKGNLDVELKISNYEAPFKIHEYESIKKLNDLVEMLEDVDMKLSMFQALVTAGIVDPFDNNLNADYLNR